MSKAKRQKTLFESGLYKAGKAKAIQARTLLILTPRTKARIKMIIKIVIDQKISRDIARRRVASTSTLVLVPSTAAHCCTPRCSAGTALHRGIPRHTAATHL